MRSTPRSLRFQRAQDHRNTTFPGLEKTVKRAPVETPSDWRVLEEAPRQVHAKSQSSQMKGDKNACEPVIHVTIAGQGGFDDLTQFTSAVISGRGCRRTVSAACCGRAEAAQNPRCPHDDAPGALPHLCAGEG